MAPQKPEDANLSLDQFADMNRRFYASSSSPHGFIRQRVRAVLVAGSRDDHVLEAQSGLRLGKFVAGFPEDDPLLDPTSVNSFVMTESVVLFHHAAESLIRLVLAHIGDPACPWLEMRRLTFTGTTQTRTGCTKPWTRMKPAGRSWPSSTALRVPRPRADP